MSVRPHALALIGIAGNQKTSSVSSDQAGISTTSGRSLRSRERDSSGAWQEAIERRVRSAEMDDAEGPYLSIFARILCAVDGTPASMVAVRQAVRLQDPEGDLHLVSVAHLAKAAHAGMFAEHASSLLLSDAETALAEARTIATSATSALLNGEPVASLIRAADADGATLLALGSHGRGRTAGLVLGSVAASLLRDSPCSILIARPAHDVALWPLSIVVGVDGSLESSAAFSVARSLAERFGGSVRAVASNLDQLDLEAAQRIAPELEVKSARALDALTAASETADLVVVGSRGLHGLKALGSVSERLAHQARSSVIVARAPSAS